MQIIPVEVYPLEKTYWSAAAAVEGAKNNPRQSKAKVDCLKLVGCKLIDAFWTDQDFVLRFSNDRWLHIWASVGEVEWEVLDSSPVLPEKGLLRVGAESVLYQWPHGEDAIQDCSTLVAKRRGAEFQNLFINEMLSIYFKGHDIFSIGAIRRTDNDQPILYVSEMN